MKTERRKFKCEGCGSARPCFVETNQEPSNVTIIEEDLKCILDETNQTSYEWIEITEPEVVEVVLPETFRRIALLFTKRCTRTKMTDGEKRAWKKVGGVVKEHDLVELEWFYGLDKSDDFDSTWRRVGMPATLLNSLDSQLDHAHEMREAMRKSQPKLGTPTQW